MYICKVLVLFSRHQLKYPSDQNVHISHIIVNTTYILLMSIKLNVKIFDIFQSHFKVYYLNSL